MNDIKKLIETVTRKKVLELVPYESARSLFVGDKVLLDANESGIINPSQRYFERINRYPNPRPMELLSLLANLYNVKEENLSILESLEMKYK